MNFRLSHRVSIPKPYVPAVATDIRKTIAAERKRLAEQAVCVPLRSLEKRHASQ